MGPPHLRRTVDGSTRPPPYRGESDGSPTEHAGDVGASVPWAMGRRVSLAWAAVALSAAGSIWVALLPTVTHSPLDSPLGGAMVRWLFYLPLTLAVLVVAGGLIEGRARRGPVRAAVVMAALAVLAGSIAETVARLSLGHGDVLAVDGVLQRVLELARIDVPVAAAAVIGLAWARMNPDQEVGR